MTESPFNFGINRDHLALPFSVSWLLSAKMRMFVVRFLCFYICYQWYAHEQ